VSGDEAKLVGEQTTQTIAARLAEHGWTVALNSVKPPRFSISFEHPLTSDVILSLDSTTDSLQSNVERFLNRREFATVRAAPSEIPHAGLLRAIRENAKGLEWPPSVIERLALILGANGALTGDEAEWLETAGAAWYEGD
jgi:hypothetical protein